MNPEYSLEGLMLKLKLKYFSHLMWRANSLEKILMLGIIEGREEMTEYEMVGWYHQLDEHEFEQAPRDAEGQGSLVCWSSRGYRESDTTEPLDNNSSILFTLLCLSSFTHRIAFEVYPVVFCCCNFYLFLTELSHWYAGFSVVGESGSSSLVAVHRLLVAMTALVA